SGVAMAGVNRVSRHRHPARLPDQAASQQAWPTGWCPLTMSPSILPTRPELASLAKLVPRLVICSPHEARKRLKRIEQLGFDEVLIGSYSEVVEDIETVRDFLQPQLLNPDRDLLTQNIYNGVASVPAPTVA